MDVLTVVFLVLGVLGALGAIPVGQYAWRRFILKRSSVEEMLEQLQWPPPGALPASTKSLAAQATARTERLLAEAVELQNQHKDRDAIERLLTAYQMDLPPLARTQLHLLVGDGFLRLSELAKAEGHYRQALDVAHQGTHVFNEPYLLNLLGVVSDMRGDLDGAERYYKEARAKADEQRDRPGVATALGNLIGVLARADRLKDADSLRDEARAATAEARLPVFKGTLSFQEAELAMAHQYLDEAGQKYTTALETFDTMDWPVGRGRALAGLGEVRRLQNRLEEAEALYCAALHVQKEISNRLGQADALTGLGLLEMQRGGAAARGYLSKARELYREIGAGGPSVEKAVEGLRRLEEQKEH